MSDFAIRAEALGKRYRIGAAFAVALSALLAHARFLGIYFTGRDLPGLMLASQNFGEIFGKGLMGSETYFRPVSNLSYALDLALFGTNPLGYHLTDVVLHCLTALGTFAFVRVSVRRTDMAVAAGLIVALHPAAIEVIPNISHHMDVLATLLVVVTLTLLARALGAHGAGDRGRAAVAWGGLAVAAFLLAVLAKEIAFVTVGLIGWYVFCMHAKMGVKQRAARALMWMIPFVLVAAAVLSWRASILGSALGNVVQSPFANLLGWLKDAASNTLSYFWFLLFPEFPGPRAFESDQLVQFARANAAPLGFTLALAVVVGLNLYLARSRGRQPFGYAVFLSGWLVLPLAVFLVTLFRYRYFYFVLPPFAILLALVSVTLLGNLRRSWSVKQPDARVNWPRLIVSLTGLLGIALLLAELLYLSPLLKPYGDFEASGRFAQRVVQALDQVATTNRESARSMVIENLPAPLWRASMEDPQSRELAGLWIPGYYRWLVDQDVMQWCVRSIARSESHDVPFEVRPIAEGAYLIRFLPDPQASVLEYPSCCTDFACK